MADLNEILKQKRPNLSVSSLYSYSSTLRGLHKRVFGDTDIDVKNFNKVDIIMKDLETKPATVRKTILAILYVLTGIEDYQKQMTDDIKSYNEEVDKQEMNEKQKDAHLSQEEIFTKFKELEKKAKGLYKKAELTKKDKQAIQDYIIVALTSGIFIPPRRSLDWVQFKIKDVTDTDNFLDKNKLVFKTFKGSAKKGEQEIVAPKALMAILNKWFAINETEYLLHDINGNQLNNVKLTQRLNKIFGSGFSINNLRHSYLSEKYQGTIALAADMEKTFEAMGSSTAQSKIYINKIAD
jgi:uncharacterized protein YoxC